MILMLCCTLWLILTQWTSFVMEDSTLGKILVAPLMIAMCCVLGWAGVQALISRYEAGFSLEMLYRKPVEQFISGILILILLFAPIGLIWNSIDKIKEWREDRE